MPRGCKGAKIVFFQKLVHLICHLVDVIVHGAWGVMTAPSLTKRTLHDLGFDFEAIHHIDEFDLTGFFG
jgi:hypothetical protein